MRLPHPFRTLAGLALCLCLCSGSAAAQCAAEYTFDGLPGDWLGRYMACAGDVNNDGAADIIVGAYKNSNNGVDAGRAFVISGADGSQLHKFIGGGSNDQLGRSVGSLGDINDDGAAELLLGEFSGAYGRIYVVDGATFQTLYAVYGGGFGKLGKSVNGAGDVNNDGVPDFIAGAPETANGCARVYSGVDGELLYHFYGAKEGDHFGWSVDGAGDVNNDGYDDVIVGSEWDYVGGNSVGRAYLYSGIDGALIRSHPGVISNSSFGRSVTGLGDLDGDNHDDYAVGSHTDGVYVYSGFDGAELYHLVRPSSALFGAAVNSAGDVNGDGTPDLVIGAPWEFGAHGMSTGRVYVFSGATGVGLNAFAGDESLDIFGSSVDALGDINGDGSIEIAVGAYGTDGGANAGRVYTISVVGDQCCCVNRGDLNRDGSMNIADVTYGVGYIFSGGPAAGCFEESDANGDGTFNIADLSLMILATFQRYSVAPCPK